MTPDGRDVPFFADEESRSVGSQTLDAAGSEDFDNLGLHSGDSVASGLSLGSAR